MMRTTRCRSRAVLPLLLAVVVAAGCDDDAAPTGTADPLLPPDVQPPTVSVGPLPGELTSFRFRIPVRHDDGGGSGVRDYELWKADAYGDTALVGVHRDTLVAHMADTSGAHAFWAVATDHAGNRSAPSDTARTTVPDRIVIVDNNGEHWDITHAMLRYNLHLSGWEHGMGRDAFPPYVDPPLAYPGGPAYPDPGRTFDTVGVAFGGRARGYAIDDFVHREAVNDTMAGVHYAAVY